MTTMLAEATAAARDAPPEWPLNVYRGDSRGWVFRFWADAARTVPYDLEGAELAAQMRRDPDALAAVDLDLDLTPPNMVAVHLTAEASRIAPTGRWDMQATWPDGRVATVVRGRVAVLLDVTHD